MVIGTSAPAGTVLWANVLLNLPIQSAGNHEQEGFTYRVPEEFQDLIAIGMPVLVPFGRMDPQLGIVVSLPESFDSYAEPREILDVLEERPLFHPEYLSFLQWVGERTVTPLAQVLDCALPSILTGKQKRIVNLKPDWSAMLPDGTQSLGPIERTVVGNLEVNDGSASVDLLQKSLGIPRTTISRSVYKLRRQGIVTIETKLSGKSVEKTVAYVKALKNTTPNEKHQSVLALLEPYSQGLPVAEVCRQLSISPSVINTMARNGLVSLEKRPVFRNPLNHAVSEIKEASRHPLTEAQSEIVDAVLTMEPACEPQLLYGVTGSGKTEVYMALTEAVTATGRAVLLMVPEIALTSQIARRFIERFGMEHIALWHSNISPGEKLDTWRRLQSGELKILVGARSAIFGPLKDIGLIILDEEHDGSYKQDSPAPRYHARTLAVELAKRHNARLLLGSATPDLTDFTQACASGRMHHLASRFGQSGMAEVSILDMRPFIGSATSGIVSQPLRQALEDTLARQEQAIILINRRGFYTTLSCGRCHYFFQCPHCDVLLTVHKISGHVRCHYCGYEQETPQYCPQCAGMTLAQSGVGTQRVEHELNSAFPEARIVRLDTDILRRKGAFAEILQSFGDGKIDILVGTQMVAKGLDFENVTLVGVINSDASFNMPDYKSSERGFQLLTQVAGRAGRGSKKGQVLIQSLDPEHPVIQYAKQQDFDGFYKYEMLVRERLGFPPFGELFRFIVSGKDEIRTRHFIRAATLNLQQQIEDEGLAPYMEILGPASCMIGRIEDRYRFHVLVKSKADGDQAHSLISRFFRSVTPPDEINFILDVEPQSLL